MALYSLNHAIDMDWMKEAYRLTRKDGAPGIDGVTAAIYEMNLEANLCDLLDRIKSGRYQAPPPELVEGAPGVHPQGALRQAQEARNGLWASRPSKTRSLSGR